MRRLVTTARLRFSIVMLVGIVCAIQTPAAQNPAPTSSSAAPSVSGADVYQKRCASCHDQAGSRAPSRDALQKLSAARILRTLDFGLMMAVAYPINRAEREAVANFLGTKTEESPLPASAFCAANISIMSGPASDTWAGWSPSASNARYQTAEPAGLAPGQVRRLKLKWALGFPGDVTAFAAPTVLNGTLFVGSASGAVEAVDAKTGCLLWKKRIDEHEATRLTGSSAALNGVVFIPAASWEETRSLDPQYVCCTFRGSITALRVRNGSVVWKTYTINPPQKTGTNSAGSAQWGPSGAPVWSAPTVDTKRGLLYVSTGDNYSV